MSARDLLFEIGVEELPAGYVPPALEQLDRGVRTALAAERLTHGETSVYGTPRRLTLLVRDVAATQAALTQRVQGPPVKVAYDASGAPTPALTGFCRKQGLDPAVLTRSADGQYVEAEVERPRLAAIEVLPALLAQVAVKLSFPKSMRWDGGDYRFGRPVRWLLALLGGDVVPVRAFGLTAGRITQGHRFLHRGTLEIAEPGAYLDVLRQAHVLADPVERRRFMLDQVEAVAAAEGGRMVADDELVDICTYLVEWPHAFAGRFEERYLDLPREVIVTALREHQRFFAFESGDGALRPGFLAVRNGDARGLEVVRRGNERVLVARLEDARFYWDTDLKSAPASQVERLDAVVWMEGLGSLRAKAARLESLTGWLADRLAPAERDTVVRASLLCKTDLLGEMIGSGKEYASLEGIMGGHYARRHGEPEPVATAIAEHYLPRGAGDALPAHAAGALLALADKLDHVAGAFVAGKVPSGSEDPFGVRRAGNGVVRLLVDLGHHLDLRAATMEATRPFFAADPELAQAEIMRKLGEFWRSRIEVALEDRGQAHDTREAALEARILLDGAPRPGWCDAADALLRSRTLTTFRGDPRFSPLVVLFKRVANILKAASEALPPGLDRARLIDPYEKALLDALDGARKTTTPLWEKRQYDAILPALLEMEGPIHGFFEKVMVNVEDPQVRGNRLRLLSEVRDLFVRGWDLSRVVVEGERG